MKKSNFVAMMLGTVAGVLFALGMCMALLPEWNSFNEGVILGVTGIILGVTGIILGLVTILIWRKMEKKAPIKLNGRITLITLFGILGALILGVGMCFCMVWENILAGTFIGLIGILMLISLIPIIKGIK